MKRYLMEFVGTFFLAIAISLIGNPIAIGLMLMAMIYVGGHVSGAHFNPAISFAMFMQNRMNIADMGWYIAAQSVGASLALWLFMLVTNNPYMLEMVPGNLVVGPMAMEGLLVLVLCWVYLMMNCTNRYRDTVIQGIVIGLTLMALVSAGTLCNPAVAIASTLSNVIREGSVGEMGSILVYIVGPLLGAAGASFMFNYFKPQA
jgi:aquaporin Z